MNGWATDRASIIVDLSVWSLMVVSLDAIDCMMAREACEVWVCPYCSCLLCQAYTLLVASVCPLYDNNRMGVMDKW